MRKYKNIIIAIILSLLMFCSYYGNNLEELYKLDYDSAEANELAFEAAGLNLIINVGAVIVVPLLIKIFDKKSFYRSRKVIFVMNAIIWFFLSIPLFNLIDEHNMVGLGILGTVMFSLISYFFLVNKEKLVEYQEYVYEDDTVTDDDFINTTEKIDNKETKVVEIEESKKEKTEFEIKKEEKQKNNEEQYTYICSNCGSKVKDSDTKCPQCGESFDDEEVVENPTTIDQKYNDLTKLKELLDKNIISKEEFEKEKKKVLDSK